MKYAMPTIANGRVYVAGRDEGIRSLDLTTGKTLKTLADIKCGSNANIIAVDSRLIYQPEGQHGGQQWSAQ